MTSDSVKLNAQVFNDHELQKLLKQLPQKISGRIMRDATKKACKPITAFMKAEVPKGKNKNKLRDYNKATTKHLRKAIASKVKTYKSGKQKGVTYAVIGPRSGEKYRNAQIPWKGAVDYITLGAAFEYGWNMQRQQWRRRSHMYAKFYFPKLLANQLGPAVAKESARLAKKLKTNKPLSSSEQKAIGKLDAGAAIGGLK